MDLEKFCVDLHKLNLTQPQQGLALLWFLDKADPGASRTPGELARILRDNGLGDAHSTRLGASMRKSGQVLASGERLRIKPTHRTSVAKLLSQILAAPPPEVDHDNGYLPEAVWKGTLTYVEKIARQVNGCYEFGFYDGASVLVRRVIETLLIECYEHRNITDKIKRDGNFKMLSDIIVSAVDHGDLPLGRETKHVLKDIKKAGDRSAHTLRYIAVKADLDRIRPGVRVAVDDLLHLAGRK